jgi:radical SAM superfamily enzyme YgiQ (UPF0313 family)
MKCALIVPAWKPTEVFASKTLGSQINYWQPLGVLYIAACLRQAGHDVRFYDGGFLDHETLLRQVADFAPGFAGIYATTFGWDKARRTALDLKRGDPRLFTCAGGPYPSAVREGCLADDDVAIDAVVAGEGEIAACQIADRLDRGQSLRGIAGVAFRENGAIVSGAMRPLIEDLDSLPLPARDLLGEAGRYIPPPGTYRRKPVATMITSRGCDRRCLFCFQLDRQRKSGVRGVRYRSLDNVLHEIGVCLDQGYREIKFLDDSLASDYGRAMELAREIKRRGWRFSWFASACASQVDRPLLQAFREAGCWAVLIGAESGVQKNLNTLRKATTLEQIRQAVRAAKEAGLHVSTPFVFGIPGETYADALETIDFAIELDAHLANFHALTPFPGTPLHEQHEKWGTVSSDLSAYTYQGAAFVPFSMTRDEIQQLRQLALRRFYSRPMFVLRRLMALRNLDDCRAALAGAKSLFWLWVKKDLFRRYSRKYSRASAG